MQNLFSKDTSSLTIFNKRFQEIIELYMDVLHKRYQEIVEIYKNDKYDLPFTEKIYIQGFMDGFFKGLKEKEPLKDIEQK